MSSNKGGLLTAHDLNHVDRVLYWAVWIAREESFRNLDIVEVTALLHDIGFLGINVESDRNKHGEIGAEIASRFLTGNSSLTNVQIEQIAIAIRYHNVPPSRAATLLLTLGKRGELVEIIRDADILDALGAVGIMRAFTSKSHLEEYDPGNVKGETWGLTTGYFLTKKASKGIGFPQYIMDQINWQMTYPRNLHTRPA